MRDAHRLQQRAGFVDSGALDGVGAGQAQQQAEEAAGGAAVQAGEHVFQHRQAAEQAAVLEGAAHAHRRDVVRRAALDFLAATGCAGCG